MSRHVDKNKGQGRIGNSSPETRKAGNGGCSKLGSGGLIGLDEFSEPQ